MLPLYRFMLSFCPSFLRTVVLNCGHIYKIDSLRYTSLHQTDIIVRSPD